MKAAVFRGVQDMQVEDVEAPKADAGDVIVAVTQCGICGSDLHTYLHGSFVEPGQVMGHEFVGEVVETGGAVKGSPWPTAYSFTAPALQRVRPLRRGSLQPLRQGLDAGDRLRQARRVRRAGAHPRGHIGPEHLPPGRRRERRRRRAHRAPGGGGARGQARGARGRPTAVVLGLGTIGQQVVQALRAREPGA